MFDRNQLSLWVQYVLDNSFALYWPGRSPHPSRDIFPNHAA